MICFKLTIGIRSICFLARRTFQLKNNYWQTIQKHYNIRTFIALLYNCPLINYSKRIIIYIIEIN